MFIKIQNNTALLGNLLKLEMVFYTQKMMSREYVQLHHHYSSFMNHSFCHQKKKGIMSRKKTENVNEDTIGNEIVTSDQLVNAMQGIFSYADPECTNIFIYFVK
jgi:hypothetical protein